VDPLVVLLTATSRDDKLWDERHWCAVGQALSARGLTPVLPSGNALERQRAERLAAAVAGAVVAPPLRLPQLAALIARASLAIGVDTGLAHLAAALRVPVVALYMATDPALTGVCGTGFVRNLGVPRCPTVGAGGPDGRRAGPARMSRLIYSLLFYLAMPLVWLRLLWRARRQPEYLQQLGERHGFYGARSAPPLLWLHAVSVGETRAAEPLIEALLRDYPEHGVLLTHMTPTGRAAGGELLRRYPGRVLQTYLPYDLPGACGRFLDHFRPQIGLLMETEIWPNLIAAARQRHLPLALINARLSARSQRGYARLPSLIGPALASLNAVAAQTAADGERLQQLGACRVSVCGNLKFDVTPASEKLRQGASWRQALGTRPVWLAASTREGEEALILEAFAAMRIPGLLLLLVPRHPQRFAVVAALRRRSVGCGFAEGAPGHCRHPQRRSGSATAWVKWRLITRSPTWR
jgi:hypothetical protein